MLSSIINNNSSNENNLENMINGEQKPNMQRKVTTTDKIDQIKLNREARRLRMEEIRKMKSEREAINELQGIKVDVEF